MRKKRALHFVIGGHGGQAAIEFWLDERYDHDVILNVVDWGGSTGVLGRALEKVGVVFLPPGDLRNNAANYLQVRFGQLVERLVSLIQERELNRDKVKVLLEQLLNEIRNTICPEIDLIISIKEIENFLSIYFAGYDLLSESEKGRDGKYERHSIGNLFLYAIAFKHRNEDDYGGFEILNKKLHEINFLKDNVNFHFAENRRKILCVCNEQGYPIIIGEDNIDEVTEPIRLGNYRLYDPYSQEVFLQTNPKIQTLIQNADSIFIPPGSEGNTYPWLTLYTEYLRFKKIWRIVNIARDRNSAGIAHEMVFHNELGLEVTYLMPKDIDQLIKEIGNSFLKIIGLYIVAEGKHVQFFDFDRSGDYKGLDDLENLLKEEGFRIEDIARLMELVLPIMDVIAYNGLSLNDAALQDEIQILRRGFRHLAEQVAIVCSYILENSEKPAAEIRSELKRIITQKHEVTQEVTQEVVAK